MDESITLEGAKRLHNRVDSIKEKLTDAEKNDIQLFSTTGRLLEQAGDVKFELKNINIKLDKQSEDLNKKTEQQTKDIYKKIEDAQALTESKQHIHAINDEKKFEEIFKWINTFNG